MPGASFRGMEDRWVCPACDREFELAEQAHPCVPGGTVDQSFAGRPPEQRAIYDVLITHLRTLGPVQEDAVRVGVFLKHRRKLAEARPKARALSLELVLPRPLNHPRVVRSIPVSADRIVHVLRLSSVADVDAELLTWVTEAYHAAG